MLTAEQEAVLRSIKKLMDFWQILPEELGLEAVVPVVKVVEEVALPSGPKYRHPISGETWDGQGSQPAWIRVALTKEGYLVEELRCVVPPTGIEPVSAP